MARMASSTCNPNRHDASVKCVRKDLSQEQGIIHDRTLLRPQTQRKKALCTEQITTLKDLRPDRCVR
jgi:hypothetical protein